MKKLTFLLFFLFLVNNINVFAADPLDKYWLVRADQLSFSTPGITETKLPPEQRNKWFGAKWSTQDYILEGTWLAIHALDWGTTLDIAAHPDQYHEINPILGLHPSRETVNLYMAASALGHVGVVYILPPKWRPYFQGITIGMSGILAIHNLSIGLKINY